MEKTKGAESLRKALGLLDIVKSDPSGTDMAELVKRSGLARPTAYRMVAALTEEGFLSQNGDGRTLHLGPKLMELAQSVWSDGDLRGAALLELERLIASRLGSRAQLFVRSGTQMTCIEEASSAGRGQSEVGRVYPILSSAAGKAVLAFSGWSDIEHELDALAPNASAEDLSLIKSELGVARSRFYAMSHDEQSGSATVSAPIFDFTGKPVAALVFNFPTPEKDAVLLHSAGASILQAARSVSRSRGGYPFGIDVPGSHTSVPAPGTTMLAQAATLIGDSPIFDKASGDIVFIDILGPSLLRLPNGHTHASRTAMDEVVGALVSLPDNTLLLAQQTKINLLDADGQVSAVRRVSGLPAGFRYNDGACDRRGRVWLGVMDMAASQGAGMLHCYDDLDSNPRVLPGLSLPNGMAFSADGTQFYVIDSMEKSLSVFDYDVETSTTNLARQSPLLKAKAGRPSGLAIAPDGTLYTCHWDGGEVLAIDTNGQVLKSYPLPVPRPSGIAVDEQANRLIVTSARARLSESDLERFPLSGALFSIDI